MTEPLIPASPREADYAARTADEPPLPDGADPFALFATWLEAAKRGRAERRQRHGAWPLSIRTACPMCEWCCLKDVDSRGFTFFTNTESAKGLELAGHPKAALVFHWKSLRRQVRVRGLVEPVSAEEADAYFASRARASQIGAWASDQSRPMAGRHDLEKRVAEYGLKFGPGQGGAAAALVRLPHRAAGVRVLARPSVSPARAVGVFAGPSDRALGDLAALPLIGQAEFARAA